MEQLVEKTYKVTGVSHYLDAIQDLASEGEDYGKTKRELVDDDLIDEKLWKYEFFPGSVQLIPEPDNPYDDKAIKVMVDGHHVGYIKSGSCAHLLKVLKENRVKDIDAQIGGGPYKLLWENEDTEHYELETGDRPYFVKLTVTELQKVAQAAAVPEPQPAAPEAPRTLPVTPPAPAPVQAKPREKKSTRNIIIITLCAMLPIVIFLPFYYIFTVGLGPVTSTPQTTTATETAPVVEVPEETTLDWLDAYSPYPYAAGTYQIGKDLAAGEYEISADVRKIAHVQIASDPDFKKIICDFHVSTFGFITVREGEFLNVSQGRMIEAESAMIPSPNSSGIYWPGTYRAGIDIDPGVYAVLADDGEKCYIEVASDSRHIDDSIKYNDLTEETGVAILEEGDYLTVENGKFKKAE